MAFSLPENQKESKFNKSINQSIDSPLHNQSINQSILEHVDTAWRTFFNSASISPARMTSGPRTAYSMTLMFAFIESSVRVFFEALVWCPFFEEPFRNVLASPLALS
jgi:hypothetical protein